MKPNVHEINVNLRLLFQLILVSVLNCLYDAISLMLRKNVEKRVLLDGMDGAFLAVDEICDNGYDTTICFRTILAE
jgi:hypothetical protein